MMYEMHALPSFCYCHFSSICYLCLKVESHYSVSGEARHEAKETQDFVKSDTSLQVKKECEQSMHFKYKVFWWSMISSV